VKQTFYQTLCKNKDLLIFTDRKWKKINIKLSFNLNNDSYNMKLFKHILQNKYLMISKIISTHKNKKKIKSVSRGTI